VWPAFYINKLSFTEKEFIFRNKHYSFPVHQSHQKNRADYTKNNSSHENFHYKVVTILKHYDFHHNLYTVNHVG
ncbi:hypothetical protein, partial [Morganella morganii]|uniref:hypothetical protein n=1 Tax=Morganella morganii TaxID=582 RepID=UPI001C8CBEF0